VKAWHRKLSLAVFSTLLADCSRPGASAATDSATVPSVVDHGGTTNQTAPLSQPRDAGVRSSPVPLLSVVAVVGGKDISMPRSGAALIDPSASFRVEVAVPLTDGRLALHDERDAMVASTGTAEVGGSYTRYHLVPEQLLPGTAYALRLDGAATHETHDVIGRAYQPVLLRFRTRGERRRQPASRTGQRGSYRR